MREFIMYRLFTIGLIFVVVALSGCAQRTSYDYKLEADKEVYSIIDHKWEEDFGSRINYKMSDTEPLPDDIQPDQVTFTSGMLTLPQAVTLATAHNRQYQLEKENLYIKALDLRLVRHDFESQFLGGGTTAYATIDGDDGMTAGTAFSFNQLLATGARIGANIALGWARILTGDMQGSALGTVLSATITQPLLRGSDRRVVMENLTQAERDTLYQIRLFNRFRKTFVVSIISQYYLVLQQLDAVKNAEDNYGTLLNVRERAEKLANAGRLPRFELDQAYQDKLEAEDSLIQAQKEYKQALDEFKIALSLPTGVQLQLDVNELEVLSKTELTEPDFFEAEAVETALGQRLDLANGLDTIADAERKVFVAADGLGAELNLVAGAEVPIRNLGSDSKGLEDMFAVALQLDLPLDRVIEQNAYRKALITFNQSQREYEEAIDTVVLEVRQAYRDLKEAAERYRVQSETLELSQKRFKNTFLLLQYNRANTRDVLDAQGDLYDAKDAATTALVNYTIATLNFYRDVGVLQVNPDGMWQTTKVADERPLAVDLPVAESSFILGTVEEQLETKEFNN